MPSTYTYAELINHAQSIVKGIPISTISALAVDQLNSMIWMAYPWKWTRTPLTAIPLVDSTQDYSVDAADTRFHSLLLARITLTSSTPNQYRDLRVTRHLEPSLFSKITWPNFQLISFENEVNKLRLESAVQVPSGLTMRINGEYKLTPLKLTNLASTIVFPDHYANVFVNGILWMLYRLANDDRAGTAVLQKNVVQYTGQLGVFYDSLVMVKDAEESGIGDTVYPEESIGAPSLYLPGVF